MLTWVLLTVLIGLLYWLFKKPSGLPPGRWGLPLIGYIPLYTRDPNQIISDLRKEHGDIFTWKAGGHVLVGLCDYKLIKNVFNRPECQGRPDLLAFNITTFHSNSGLVKSVGDVWVQGRRFALRHLKDFGMGKSSLEDVIQYEAQNLASSFDKDAGKPIEMSWNLNVAVLNVIWKLVANQRYEIDDEEIMKFNKMFNDTVEVNQGRVLLLDAFPGIHKYLPKFILRSLFKTDLLCKNMEKFRGFILDIVENHLKSFDPNGLRDYIDAYINQIQEEKGNLDTVFKEDHVNLVTSIFDLFSAGSETTSSTTRWMVAIMANHPEIQKKMQHEIDDVVSRDRLPSLQDKDKLPYTEAVLYEVLRYSSLLPIGIFHATTEDIQVGDYHIPKNTTMFASSRSCHKDPKYFERPDEFYPEHFLDENGKVNHKKEGFMPFSLGRRQCLGENLAKMEFFLFATCLFQRFSVAPPKGKTIALEGDHSQPVLNFIKPYKVILTKRI